MSRKRNQSKPREVEAPPAPPVQETPPFSPRTRLWLLVTSGLAWLAGIGFLVAMTVMRFKADPIP
jgi:hypothetical protein